MALPADATLWSASLAGRPIRPGVDPNGALLLPLRKGRASEDAPAFAVEILYLQRSAGWTDRGDVRLSLPTLDLPVSRTGVTLYYSPRYAIAAKPGVFRAATDPGPFSAALRPPPPPATRGEGVGAASAVGYGGGRSDDSSARNMKTLLDRFQQEAGHARQGVIPIAIAFPSVGPSQFFEAELTAEAQSPSLDLEYRRTGGR